MIIPAASQNMKRHQVIAGSSRMSQTQVKIAPSGTHGTSGVRKGRGRSGSLQRRIKTPAATSTKANNVPILHKSTTSLMLLTPANPATNTPVRIVVTYGVRNRGCTLAAHRGSNPSRAMTNKIRGWPSWKTNSTEVVATTAPNETIPAAQLIPRAEKAVANGSAVPSSVDFNIPVSTTATVM